MAVLVRSTPAVLATLRRALIAAGVPVAVRGEDLPLAEQPAVADAAGGPALRPVRRPRSTEDVAERLLLGPIGGGDVVYLRRLRRALRALTAPRPSRCCSRRPCSIAPARELLPEHVAPAASCASPASLAAGRGRRRAGGSAEDVLWAMWRADRSGRALGSGASAAGGPGGAAADRDLDAVRRAVRRGGPLHRSAAAGRTLAEFLEHLAAQQIPGDALGRAGGADAEAVRS